MKAGQLFAERYKIIELAGKGGMGWVYLAEDQMLENAEVALKILLSEYCSDPKLSKRFLQEVQLTRKLNHPNIVRTYEVGKAKEQLYFTMEYVRGQVLRKTLKANPPDIQSGIDILLGVCHGLSAIHHSRIIHRDLTTGNIIISEQNEIKIMDFGIARQNFSELTAHDEVVGSAPYIPPESWLGKEISAASDLYSLGIVAYEIFTGIRPFSADSPGEYMYKHLDAHPVCPTEMNPELPGCLDQLIMQLLEKEPSKRPHSIEEVISGLGEAAHDYMEQEIPDQNSQEEEVDEPEYQIPEELIYNPGSIQPPGIDSCETENLYQPSSESPAPPESHNQRPRSSVELFLDQEVKPTIEPVAPPVTPEREKTDFSFLHSPFLRIPVAFLITGILAWALLQPLTAAIQPLLKTDLWSLAGYFRITVLNIIFLSVLCSLPTLLLSTASNARILQITTNCIRAFALSSLLITTLAVINAGRTGFDWIQSGGNLEPVSILQYNEHSFVENSSTNLLKASLLSPLDIPGSVNISNSNFPSFDDSEGGILHFIFYLFMQGLLILSLLMNRSPRVARIKPWTVTASLLLLVAVEKTILSLLPGFPGELTVSVSSISIQLQHIELFFCFINLSLLALISGLFLPVKEPGEPSEMAVEE